MSDESFSMIWKPSIPIELQSHGRTINIQYVRRCLAAEMGGCNCTGQCHKHITPQEKKRSLEEELAYLELECQRNSD